MPLTTKIMMEGARGPFRLAEQRQDGRTLYLVTNDEDLLVAVWDAKEWAETLRYGLETNNVQIAIKVGTFTEH